MLLRPHLMPLQRLHSGRLAQSLRAVHLMEPLLRYSRLPNAPAVNSSSWSGRVAPRVVVSLLAALCRHFMKSRKEQRH